MKGGVGVGEDVCSVLRGDGWPGTPGMSEADVTKLGGGEFRPMIRGVRPAGDNLARRGRGWKGVEG